jgi:ribosomal protein S18 acetylase RimI-like enzyme
MTATIAVARTATPGQMRPLNVLRDLPAVADLIELCFASTMDAEGRSYVDQMRRNGRDSSFLGWASKVIDSASLPLSGFIWEDGGRIVGNVSLIPFFKGGRKIYLIANVATHPDYRRRGIARILTENAMRRARAKHAASLWLHVRQDNQGAITLYRDLGFQERAQRTNWFASPGAASQVHGHGRIDIHTRVGSDWPAQRAWLARAYPDELSWYGQQNWDVFQPGLFSSVYRFMADINTSQWSAYRGNLLQGVLACQRTYGRADHLWAAFPENPDPHAFTAVLLYARRMLTNSHGTALEYPAGTADEAIGAAGFSSVRTLVWMEAPGGLSK